jgi:hypothetical protein
VGEAAEAEADALDPLDEVVHRLGGPVAHPSAVPGDDLVPPAEQGAAEGVHLDRAALVLQVLTQLVDELGVDSGLVEP